MIACLIIHVLFIALKSRRIDLAKVEPLTLEKANRSIILTPTFDWFDFMKKLIAYGPIGKGMYVTCINVQINENDTLEFSISVKSFNKTSEVYFQVDYLEDLREFLSLAFEIRSKDSAIYDDERAKARKTKFLHILNNYLTWCALRKYINYASKPFRKVHEDFIKGLSGGKIADRRWKVCVMTS